jgi:hypothetical protein
MAKWLSNEREESRISSSTTTKYKEIVIAQGALEFKFQRPLCFPRAYSSPLLGGPIGLGGGVGLPFCMGNIWLTGSALRVLAFATAGFVFTVKITAQSSSRNKVFIVVLNSPPRVCLKV